MNSPPSSVYWGAPSSPASLVSDNGIRAGSGLVTSPEGSEPSSSNPRPYLPNFTGKEVHMWLYRAQQLMDFYNITGDLRVRMAALYLEEEPLEWYRGIVRAEGRPLSWVEFEKELVSMYAISKAHKVFDGIPQPLPLLIRHLCDKIPQPTSQAQTLDVNAATTSLAPASAPPLLQSCIDFVDGQTIARPIPNPQSNGDLFTETLIRDLIANDAPVAEDSPIKQPTTIIHVLEPKLDVIETARQVFDEMCEPQRLDVPTPYRNARCAMLETKSARRSAHLWTSFHDIHFYKFDKPTPSAADCKTCGMAWGFCSKNALNSVTNDSDCYCTTNLCEGSRSTMVPQLARSYLSKLDYLQCPPGARRNAPTQLVPPSEALQNPSPPTGYAPYYPTSVAPVRPTSGSDSSQEMVNAPRESLPSNPIDLFKVLNRTKRVGCDGLPTSLSTNSVPYSPRLETTPLFESMSSFKSINERRGISFGVVSRLPTPNLHLHPHNTAALVDMYARCWTIRDTYKVLDEISQRDMVLWLCGNAQLGQWNEALDLFGEMIETLFGCTTANVGSPDQKLAERTSKLFVPTTTLVAFLIWLGWVISRKAHLHQRSWIPKARMMLEEMCGSGFTLVSYMNVDRMIIARGTSGFSDADLADPMNIIDHKAARDEAKAVSMADLEDALQVFEISGRSVSHWNAMIDRLVVGYGELTPKMFRELERLLLVPDDTTFIRILNGRNHSGLLQKGLMCCKAMKLEYQLELKIQHYGCIVDILGRAGSLEEAWKLMRGMPNVLVLPRSVEYGEVRMKDTCAEVTEHVIIIKLTGISLYSKLSDDSLKSYKGEQSENEYLINLIDSPGHVDFSFEIIVALCIIGGALLVVDCIIRACVQTETVRHQAVEERIMTVLTVNKMDQYFLELQVEGASWIQFNEPTFVWDLNSHKWEAFTKAYSALESSFSSTNVLIVSYFADVPAEAYKTLAGLSGISGFRFVCVNGPRTIALIEGVQPRGLG